MTKGELYELLKEMEYSNEAASAGLADTVSVEAYRARVRMLEEKEIWTDAIQGALREHEIVLLPEKETPYYLDGSILMPPGRKLVAGRNAVIKLLPGIKVLMLRNENARDGSLRPVSEEKDENLTVIGGIWEESNTCRLGYGRTGMYDEERSFYGVSTCMFFSNVAKLTLKKLKFVHTAGFAVQLGDARDVVIEDVEFAECFADGLHVNGNCENVVIRDIAGQVGDDLVALNMYDWKSSSVNFGPVRNLLCENLSLAPESPYKALRISPGVYRYQDGTEVDCAIENAVIRNVRGIRTFKLYFQTPAYDIHGKPEFGKVGSGRNVFFEDIEIDLKAPLDSFEEYLNSDPVKGSIAGFELGSNIEGLYFSDIKIRLYKEKYPMSFFLCVGPKSARRGNMEIFDPDTVSCVKNLHLKNITCIGETTEQIHAQNSNKYIHTIVFPTGRGDIEGIHFDVAGN